MTTLEIHFKTPEDVIEVKIIQTDEDALKVIGGLKTSGGLNIIRKFDQCFIPWHSIVAITHRKENK